jgi:hypothetical protein
MSHSLRDAREMLGYRRSKNVCCLCVTGSGDEYFLRIDGICGPCRLKIAEAFKACTKKVAMIRHICTNRSLGDVAAAIIWRLLSLHRISEAGLQ